MLEGKHALITGGGSGIGLATARRLAADGATVTICGRTASRLEHAAADVGDGTRWITADVTSEADVADAVACAADGAVSGGLDVMVANAGGSVHFGSFIDADIDLVRQTFELNSVATAICIKQAARSMIDSGGGTIVATSSGAGHFPHRWLWAYGASKGGLDQLCRNAAEELGELGIRVNSVQPGIVENDLTGAVIENDALRDDYLDNMPIRRIGQNEDIADAIRFLVGPESSWITGINLAVDGGHHLRRGADYQKLFE